MRVLSLTTLFCMKGNASRSRATLIRAQPAPCFLDRPTWNSDKPSTRPLSSSDPCRRQVGDGYAPRYPFGYSPNYPDVAVTIYPIKWPFVG